MNTTGAVTAYTAHLHARALRPATITAYIGWVRRLDQATTPDLLDLTTGDLEAWIAAQHWSPNTHQKAVQAVRYFYRWCHATGHTDTDPAATLHPARPPRPVPNPCPDAVYARVLADAQGDTYWRLRLAADTGLRRSELARAHSDDVVALAGGPALRVNGKGGAMRVVPLPFDLAQWMCLQRGYAFPGRDGGHMAPDSVGRWYARVWRNAHSLRRRSPGWPTSRTATSPAFRQLLGHASVATTQRYIAVDADDMRRAMTGASPQAS